MALPLASILKDITHEEMKAALLSTTFLGYLPDRSVFLETLSRRANEYHVARSLALSHTANAEETGMHSKGALMLAGWRTFFEGMATLAETLDPDDVEDSLVDALTNLPAELAGPGAAALHAIVNGPKRFRGLRKKLRELTGQEWEVAFESLNWMQAEEVWAQGGEYPFLDALAEYHFRSEEHHGAGSPEALAAKSATVAGFVMVQLALTNDPATA